jgi:glycosyltransferase involved in cell wall biosynthesis
MISVVVSVFNTGKYLPKAIDSLINQTYGDYEIIIVDDGSNDGSEDVCEQQAQRSSRIRVFHKPNGGVSSARNYGIEKARGEWVIFPDPDDWVEPDYLERLVLIREENNADFSICGHYVHTGERTVVWNRSASAELLSREEAMDLVLLPSAFCGFSWNKLFSLKNIRMNHLLFDLELGMVQDLHFVVRYLKTCNTIAYDPIPLYHYYSDNGGVTSTNTQLSQRKMSGLIAYEKISEILMDDYPKVAGIAYYTLVDICLRYICIYYQSKMEEPSYLKRLCEKIIKYKNWYTERQVYFTPYRHYIRLACSNPRLYYRCISIRRFITRKYESVKRFISR